MHLVVGRLVLGLARLDGFTFALVNRGGLLSSGLLFGTIRHC